MNIQELKLKADTHENEARQLYIKAIKLYMSKFKRTLHAADKLGTYFEIFENLENQGLIKLKKTLDKIIESKVLESDDIP